MSVLAVTPPTVFQAAAPWCLLPAAALVVLQEPVRRVVHGFGFWSGPTSTTILMFLCGLYAGLIGVGTGTIAIAIIGFVPATLGSSIQTLLWIRNVLLTVMAVVVAVAFAVTGLADWATVALLAAPAAAGGRIGGWLVGRVPAWLLRTVIVATALAATVWMITRA